ncbi:S8 family serine peptidase [Candidatus Woesebacteria bacterium]|nr:S8 family serine peptidase [Candidatus Woesebacteria bacterium]
MKVESKRLFGRREVLRAMGLGALFFGAREMLRGIPAARAFEGIAETPSVEPALELLQQPAALAEAVRLYEADQLDTTIPVGWIDTTPLYVDLPLYYGAGGSIVDLEKSKRFPEGDPFNQVVQHATWATGFAAQRSDATAPFVSPGLSQAEWTQLIFAVDTTISIHRYPEIITYLVDAGVGVIGAIPTWTDNDLGVDEQTIAAVASAFAYAQERNVLIVIPAGNRGIDMAAPPDGARRILHDLKLKYTNVVCAGGVTIDCERAKWEERGSNYGQGFISLVTPILNRHVPAEWNQVVSGTTFATGDITSCIQLIQAIIGRDATGKLPNPETVFACMSETAHYLGKNELHGHGLLQMESALIAAQGAHKLLAKRAKK